MKSYASWSSFTFAFMFSLVAVPGFTQTPKPIPSPIPVPAPAAATEAAADMTTATFADWELRCRATPSSDPARPGGRSCELVQSVFVQGQSTPFAQLAFGRIDQKDPLLFTVVVPSDVAFGTVMKLSVAEGDKFPIDIPWVRCRPGGCFATVTMNETIIKRLQSRNEPGRIVYVTGGGRDFILPISFRGLARAFEALAREKI
jgi:invasion protein IalB